MFSNLITKIFNYLKIIQLLSYYREIMSQLHSPLLSGYVTMLF